jgi:PadR family transcriptional regulator, regulatory protein AphA
MSLRHALLGLLTARPMAGYDLAKVFDRSVAYVWHAPHSQIYPELRRMETDGLVAAQPSPRGRRGIKRVYSITADGRAELEHWLASPPEPEPTRDSQRLRASYLELVSYADARRFFQAHLRRYELRERLWSGHVEDLAARATALLRQRLAQPGIGDPEAIVAYKVHAYQGLVRQASAEVKWAREGLRLVDRLEEAASSANEEAGQA